MLRVVRVVVPIRPVVSPEILLGKGLRRPGAEVRRRGPLLNPHQPLPPSAIPPAAQNRPRPKQQQRLPAIGLDAKPSASIARSKVGVDVGRSDADGVRCGDRPWAGGEVVDGPVAPRRRAGDHLLGRGRQALDLSWLERHAKMRQRDARGVNDHGGDNVCKGRHRQSPAPKRSRIAALYGKFDPAATAVR